jgi:hypothetical protein
MRRWADGGEGGGAEGGGGEGRGRWRSEFVLACKVQGLPSSADWQGTDDPAAFYAAF